MAVMAGLTAPPPRFGAGVVDGLNLQDVADKVNSIPHAQNELVDDTVRKIASLLEGRVTNQETDDILSMLYSTLVLGPEQWLGVLDKLSQMPWKKGRSLFEKLVARGVDDSNEFIARFADQANRMLGLGLTSFSDRVIDLERGGMKQSKSERKASRSLRRDAEAVLDYFGIEHQQGFGRGLLNAFDGRGGGGSGSGNLRGFGLLGVFLAAFSR